MKAKSLKANFSNINPKSKLNYRPKLNALGLLVVMTMLFTTWTPLFAQNTVDMKVIPERILRLEKSGLDFPMVQPFQEVLDINRISVPSEFNTGAIGLVPNLNILGAIQKDKPTRLSLVIPGADGEDIIVHLHRAEIMSALGEIRIASGGVITDIPGAFYRGIVKDDYESLVAISCFDDHIRGFISMNSRNYVLGPLEPNIGRNTHILYDDKVISHLNPFECHTEDTPPESEFKYDTAEGGPRAPGDCVRIWWEVDDNIYNNKGGMANTINWMTGMTNEVYTLYDNESIVMETSVMNIWDILSPYTGDTKEEKLASFQDLNGVLDGDLAHYVSRSIVGGLAAAGFNGICNADYDESMCYSGLDMTYWNVPTYSWTIYVCTHEMGHLLGSRHTHACVWNGDNTAIDGCPGITEGPCPIPGQPAGGGTIMSRCHQSVGINFNLGFGPQPGDVIRNSINNATCLDDCICDTQMEVDWSSEVLSEYPYVVSFTDLSNFQGGGIEAVAWNWTFGDGQSSNDQHPTHTYDEPGEYEVCLDIIDSEGCIGVFCNTISIESCECEGFQYIAQNTVWNTEQFVTQHVVIEPGARLDIDNTTVRFLAKCKILVKRNARLNVINSGLTGTQCGVHSDDPYSWGGIQIWGTQSSQHPPAQVITGDLTYLAPTQGIAYISGSDLLHQDDVKGGSGVLAAGPSWPFSNMLPNGGAGGEWANHFGGIAITDNNSRIVHCRRGFDLQKWPAWPQLGWQTASYAKNTSFLEILGAIWNQQDGFSVNGSNFVNNSLVQGTRSIQNMDARISVVKSSFSGIDHAINHIYTLSGFPLPAYIGSLDNANFGNTFFNCKLGVYGIGGGDIFIGNNTFERSSSVDPWYSGVHIDGQANFEVRANDFKKQWIGLINQSTMDDFGNGYGDINCNRYFDSEYGQLNFGRNRIYLNSEDFDNSLRADVFFASDNNYPMHCPPQGAIDNAVWNYFSPQIPDHNFISPDWGNSFTYYYPDNAPTAELIPRCAKFELPNPGCAQSSVHENYNTQGGLFNCAEHDPNDPEYCEDTDCLDSIRLAIGQDLLLIDGDDTDGLLSSLSTWPSSITTYQDLLAASPYLSDTVLKEVILAATMNDSHRMDILMANAPLNAPVWNMVLSHLDSVAMISLLGVSGPSDRYILETKLHDLSYLYWSSVRHLAFDSLSPTNYPAKAALLNSLPEPEALRIRYGVELALGLYTQAASTLQALPVSMAAWSALQVVNLARITDPYYSLDSTTMLLLEGWEEDKGANGGLARGLLVILDDRMYFPDFEEEAASQFVLSSTTKAVTPAAGMMRLAPNPAGAEVTVWSGNERPDTEGVLRVYDMQGRMVLEQKGIQPMQTLSTGHLVPGLYIVALEGNYINDRQKLVIR